MFKFKTIKPVDAQKIFAIKTQGLQANAVRNLNEIGGSKTNLTMPHDSYIIGLSSLKLTDDPHPMASGMRVIDASDSGFNAIYNLTQVKGGGTEPQMLKDQKYLKSYENAFSKILKLDIANENYEVRSLKIPALHVEALWLHKDDGDNMDIYVPVRSMGLFEDKKIYDKNAFFNILRGAAKGLDLDDNAKGG